MSNSTDLPDEFLQRFANLSLSSRRRLERPYTKPIFTELANELLQQIAGYCQASDILALSQTCRRLNEACDTAFVFEMSFKNHLPTLNTTAFHNETALVQFINNYVNGSDKYDHGRRDHRKMWMCMALAVSRIPHAWSEIQEIAKAVTCKGWVLNEHTRMSLRGPLGFLATLPIWGCTKQLNRVVDLDHIFPFLEKQADGHFPQTLLQLAFLSAIRTLETHTTLHRHTMIHECATSYRENFCLKKPTVEQWMTWSKWGLLTVERMARLIRHESTHDGAFYTDPATGRYMRVKAPHHLPNSRKIEFLNFSHFEEGRKAKRPMPPEPTFPLLIPKLVAQEEGIRRSFDAFCGGEWLSWYQTRTCDLFTNLDKGEWCYAYINLARDGYVVEPTLTGIRFRHIPTTKNHFSVQVPDRQFPRETRRLRGKVFVNKGGFRIGLIYTCRHGLRHGMAGSFMPLGICGYDMEWRGTSQVTCGLFWFWKRDWVDAVAP